MCVQIADKYSVAYVTVPSTDDGKTLAHGLVKGKLAACVNIIPQVTSIYEWENKINEDSEVSFPYFNYLYWGAMGNDLGSTYMHFPPLLPVQLFQIVKHGLGVLA